MHPLHDIFIIGTLTNAIGSLKKAISIFMLKNVFGASSIYEPPTFNPKGQLFERHMIGNLGRFLQSEF